MYSVVQCVNGSYSIVAEGLSESSAKINYWERCKVLENAPDVITGQVAILNEYLQIVNDFTQSFKHTPAPAEPKQTEEVPTEG